MPWFCGNHIVKLYTAYPYNRTIFAEKHTLYGTIREINNLLETNIW